MDIEITARHFTASDNLKEFIYDRIKRIERYNGAILNCHIILIKENNNEKVEIVAHAKGHDYVSHDSADTFEHSFINAMSKISIQIKKNHNKTKYK